MEPQENTSLPGNKEKNRDGARPKAARHGEQAGDFLHRDGAKKKNAEYKARRGGKNNGDGSKSIALAPTVVVLATYILLLLSKIVDVTLIDRDNEYLSVIILQIMIFLIPGALWCRFSGERYIRTLRIRPFRAECIPIIAVSAVSMITGGLLLAIMFGGLESLSHNFSLYDTFVSKNDGSVPTGLYLVLAYAALPAICEEFVYRGILCREYERGGVIRAVILSTVFFSLLHFNVRNLPVYIFCGIMLSLVMYATRSLIGAMVAHFLYNLFGIFGQPYMSTLYNITNSSKLFTIIVGILFFASTALFCTEAARLYRNYLRRGVSADYRKPVFRSGAQMRDAFLDVLKDPCAIACFGVYIIAVVISLL
ncbi:MAG: lysostaphin resistance A-like protein [Eubacteriales bacterium]